jgi:hypothetical protein
MGMKMAQAHISQSVYVEVEEEEEEEEEEKEEEEQEGGVRGAWGQFCCLWVGRKFDDGRDITDSPTRRRRTRGGSGSVPIANCHSSEPPSPSGTTQWALLCTSTVGKCLLKNGLFY